MIKLVANNDEAPTQIVTVGDLKRMIIAERRRAALALIPQEQAPKEPR